MYNNFEIPLVVFYATYHYKSCYYLYKLGIYLPQELSLKFINNLGNI